MAIILGQHIINVRVYFTIFGRCTFLHAYRKWAIWCMCCSVATIFQTYQGNENWFEKVGSLKNRRYKCRLRMGNDFWFESTGVSQKNEGGGVVWEIGILPFFKEKKTEELDSKSLTSRNELFYFSEDWYGWQVQTKDQKSYIAKPSKKISSSKYKTHKTWSSWLLSLRGKCWNFRPAISGTAYKLMSLIMHASTKRTWL